MRRRDDRHRHPDDGALAFDPHLIGLNVLQVTRLEDVVLMDALGMVSGLAHLAAHGAAVQHEGRFNRRHRAATADEGHHPTDGVRRGLFVRQGRAGTGGKGQLTDGVSDSDPAGGYGPRDSPVRLDQLLGSWNWGKIGSARSW